MGKLGKFWFNCYFRKYFMFLDDWLFLKRCYMLLILVRGVIKWYYLINNNERRKKDFNIRGKK